LAAIGYALFGATLGGLSLLLFPNNLVQGAWRVANLVATPIAVGCVMAVLGVWRAHRGQSVLRIDRFAYGYLFALSVALVRFHQTAWEKSYKALDEALRNADSSTKVYMLVGPQGAGKSTWAKSVASTLPEPIRHLNQRDVRGRP
jgi:polynucleotide 5'-kinase involved in rRNA processing